MVQSDSRWEMGIYVRPWRLYLVTITESDLKTGLKLFKKPPGPVVSAGMSYCPHGRHCSALTDPPHVHPHSLILFYICLFYIPQQI